MGLSKIILEFLIQVLKIILKKIIIACSNVLNTKF